MARYCNTALDLLQRFSYAKLTQIDGGDNTWADELSKMATIEMGFMPTEIKLEFIGERVIDRLEFMIVEKAERC